MNNSEENEKPPSGFKDIEFNDSPEVPGSVAFQPPPTFNAASPYQLPAPPYDQQLPNKNEMRFQNTEVLAKLQKTEAHSKIVKWTSLILSVFSFLFLLPAAYPLIVTFIFPILGFVGAHKYNDCLSKFYTIYLILILIVQIIVMAVLGGVPYIVFQTLIMAAEIVILIYNIKLTKDIYALTDNEKRILMGYQAGNIS